MFYAKFLVRMCLEFLGSWDPGLENGSFARTSNTTAFGDELVVWCALVDFAKFLL
jgi:hypothetical protein